MPRARFEPMRPPAGGGHCKSDGGLLDHVAALEQVSTNDAGDLVRGILGRVERVHSLTDRELAACLPRLLTDTFSCCRV